MTKYLSLKQAQNDFDMSRSFIYQLRREGKLKFYHINSKPFIRVEDIEKLMQPEDYDPKKDKS